MYKMYDSQWDEESGDENSSFNSSFWSDREGDEEREEVEKVERLCYSQELDTTPGGATQHTQEDHPPAEEEEEARLAESKHQEEGCRSEFIRGQGDRDRDKLQDQEEDAATSAGSPALSLLTSGYGTYRPEEGGDYRDDCTIAEFDRESQGGFSELRDGDEDEDRGDDDDGGDEGKDLDDTQSYGGGSLAELEDRGDPSAVAYREGVRVSYKQGLARLEENVPYRQDDRVPCSEVGSEHHTGMRDKGEDNELNEAMVFEVEDDTVLSDVSGRKDGRSLPEYKDKEKRLVEKRSEEREGRREEKGAEDEMEREEVEKEEEESAGNKHIKLTSNECVKTYEEWEDNRRPKRVSGLEEGLGGLEVSLSPRQQPSELDSEGGDRDGASQTDDHSSDTGGLHSAFQSYIRGMARSRSESDIRSRPKSFIRPMLDHPHTRNLKKTDPVTKYFQYKQDWDMFKPPGERDRRALHWEIREQLQYQPPPPRPRRTFVPNTYVVPTDKKRLALRWEVRHDLANGLLPPKASYRL